MIKSNDRGLLASLLLAFALLLGACVSEAPSSDVGDAGQSATDAGSDADGCVSTCTPSCIERTTFVACEESPDGCFVEETRSCPSGTACDPAVGSCVSSCQTCDEGDFRCSPDSRSVDECVVDEDGCTRFVSTECADGVCAELEGDFVCLTHECAPGGDGLCQDEGEYYGCEQDDETGQWVLVYEETCGALEVCDDGAGCQCANPCTDRETVCQDGQLFICRTDPASGCRGLFDNLPCNNAAPDERIRCIDGNTAAVCVEETDGCRYPRQMECADCAQLNNVIVCQ